MIGEKAMGTDVRRVVCAANRHEDTLVLGARHFDSTMHSIIARLDKQFLPDFPSTWEQGFIDQHGRFMTRREALYVAIAAGQIVGRVKHGPQDVLFSEDLY